MSQETRIKELEISAQKNPNELVALIELCQSTEDSSVVAALLATQRVFSHYASRGDIAQFSAVDSEKRGDGDVPSEKVKKYREWLASRFDSFFAIVVKQIRSASPAQSASLKVVMKFVEMQGKLQGHEFINELFVAVVRALITSTQLSGPLLDLFVSRFLAYDDVRYFTCKNIAMLLADHSALQNENKITLEALCQNVFDLLSRVAPPAGDDEEATTSNMLVPAAGDTERRKRSSAAVKIRSPKEQRKAFSKAWLAFLRLPLPIEMYKTVLKHVHHDVIPKMSHPVMLMDFLTESYDKGGVISMLALNGLFVLITQHNLDYPQFYPKLYALLTPELFVSKYRARFFRLMHAFMTSTHLPAYIVASFAKRLGRLALSAPPHGALLCIAMIATLLRRHPQCNTLIHRPLGTSAPVSGTDPYNETETDPAKCNAMDSSLWELRALYEHYCPEVSRMARTFETNLQKNMLDQEDFVTLSYQSLFESHIKRRTKNVPLAFETPKGLFSESLFSSWELKQ